MSTRAMGFVSPTIEELAALLPGFVPLPDQPGRYFAIQADTRLLPVADLAHSRLRPDGMRSAAARMRQCHDGDRARRAPLEVRSHGDGWMVLDGNSTLAIARLSGWRCMPCSVRD